MGPARVGLKVSVWFRTEGGLGFGKVIWSCERGRGDGLRGRHRQESRIGREKEEREAEIEKDKIEIRTVVGLGAKKRKVNPR